MSRFLFPGFDRKSFFLDWTAMSTVKFTTGPVHPPVRLKWTQSFVDGPSIVITIKDDNDLLIPLSDIVGIQMEDVFPSTTVWPGNTVLC